MDNLKEIDLKFKGIDSYNRPIYKVININGHKPEGGSAYFGSTGVLYSAFETTSKEKINEINQFFRENIKELTFFGYSFDCEPIGSNALNWKLNIIDNE